MTNSKKQFGLTDFSGAKLRQALIQALPLLNLLFEAAHELSPDGSESASRSPCDGCYKRDICRKPCDTLNSHLPPAYGGESGRERKIKFDFDLFQDNDTADSDNPIDTEPKKAKGSIFKNVPKIAFSDIFEEYEKCKSVFTKKQWEIVGLYYREGMTITEIAKQLGKGTSTVSDLLVRARKQKEEYDKNKLWEFFDLKKKMSLSNTE